MAEERVIADSAETERDDGVNVAKTNAETTTSADVEKTDSTLCADADMQLRHPWPYLSSLFKLKSVQGKTVRLICLVYSPKYTECSAFITSPSNLKHLRSRSVKTQLIITLL
jgi:hypothetical protein